MVFWGIFWVVQREVALENRYKSWEAKTKRREKRERVLLQYQIINPFQQQRYVPSTSSAHFMYFQHLLLIVPPAGWRQVQTSKKDNTSTRTMLPVKLLDIPDTEGKWVYFPCWLVSFSRKQHLLAIKPPHGKSIPNNSDRNKKTTTFHLGAVALCHWTASMVVWPFVNPKYLFCRLLSVGQPWNTGRLDSNPWPGLTRNWPVESMVLLPCGPPHSMAFPAKMAPVSGNTPRERCFQNDSLHTQAPKLLPRLKHAQPCKIMSHNQLTGQPKASTNQLVWH